MAARLRARFGPRYVHTILGASLALTLVSVFEPVGGSPPVVSQTKPIELTRVTITSQGILTEEFFNKDAVCDSYILLYAENMWGRGFRAVLYCMALLWAFLGIAIISDIFMNAIEMIVANKKKIKTPNGHIEILIWNPTVANLTLMALGTSAPEILLSLIETIQNLGLPPGELGAGTIVGSAAYNMFIISAVCIMAVPDGKYKKISQLNVFLCTSIFSVFAYIWMLVVLVLITPDVVELWEAAVTFLLFPILVFIAWVLDRDCFRRPSHTAEHANEHEMQHIRVLNVDETSGQVSVASVGEKVRALHKELLDDAKKKLHEGHSDEERKEGDKLELEHQAEQIAAALEDSNPTDPRLEIFAAQHKAKGFITGNTRNAPSHASSRKLGITDRLAEPNEARVALIGFREARVSVMENGGHIDIAVVRHGNLGNACQVRVKTVEGTAIEGEKEDFVGIDQVVRFEPEQTMQSVRIAIIDDDEARDHDIRFTVHLSEPAGLGGTIALVDSKVFSRVCEVSIIDDDVPGVLSFAGSSYAVNEADARIDIKVIRTNGCHGEISCNYKTKAGSAKEGKDYESVEGTLTFGKGELEKTITVPIIDDLRYEEDKTFFVILTPTESKNYLDGEAESLETLVVIENDDAMKNLLESVYIKVMKKSKGLSSFLHASWGQQYRDAMEVPRGEDEDGNETDPSNMDYVLHFFTIFWKILFAAVPPVAWYNGWPAFCVSLLFIGILTAITGEVAELFGCSVGLLNSVTAISFVAMGTSLPDTFASKQAARTASDADAAIGNVTGSNSVNVFLGLGLPWLVGAIYAASKDTVYLVPAGTLSFSVAIYCAESIICLGTLFYRRSLGGELGGTRFGKRCSCILFSLLWVFYLAISTMQAYGIFTI